jgi:hypothetical protein
VERVQCACGCPAWWYAERREGRPREYFNETCRQRARWARDPQDDPRCGDCAKRAECGTTKKSRRKPCGGAGFTLNFF